MTGSFTAGSVLAGAYAAAAALSAPRRGRRLDLTALPGGLALPLVGGALVLAALALGLAIKVPLALLAVLAAAAAAATAGVPGGMRSLLPVLWDGRTPARAFAGDSAITEITWVAGPALTAALIAGLGTTAPVVCAVAFWLAASLLVRAIPAHRAPPKTTVARRSTTGLLRAVLPLLLLSLSIGVNLGTLDVALPALLHSRDAAPAGSGLLIAALSLSSAATVLLLTAPLAERFLGKGAETRFLGKGAETRRAVICHACYGLAFVPLALLPPFAGILAVVLVAGCFLGPAVSFTFAAVSPRVSPDRHSEAFALFMSANAVGTALGALAAGTLTDHVSTSVALLLAALPLLAAATSAASLRRARDRARITTSRPDGADRAPGERCASRVRRPRATSDHRPDHQAVDRGGRGTRGRWWA